MRALRTGRFKELFSGPRWEALRDAGAAVQRPLWASTGTKNPHYPDTMYVDGLVAPHTVNTMPMATLLAVRRPRRGDRADRRAGPDRRARGARRGGHRHATGHRGAARRRRQAVRGRDERAAGRDRGAPRRGRHGPPAEDPGSSLPSDLEEPVARARQEGRRRLRRQARLAAATRRCGEVRASPRSRIGSAG